MRNGWYPGDRPSFPLVLGSDGSGKVAAMGSEVRRFKLDEDVYAYGFANPKGGFYAENVAVAAEKVARVPRALGEDGVALVRDLGADDAVDGQHGDVSHALQNFGPVDAALVLVGGENYGSRGGKREIGRSGGLAQRRRAHTREAPRHPHGAVRCRTGGSRVQ
jgi:NADPH:quinone reductase-like Zn-dependent oxidoreductase